jgi:hypothetical protein
MDGYTKILADFFNEKVYLENERIRNAKPEQLKKIDLLIDLELARQRSILAMLQNMSTPEQSPTNERKRCMARIHSGNQCSRKCKSSESDFCGSHMHSLPYGRIDQEPTHLNKLVEKKTRGRRSKNKTNIDLSKINLGLYIKTKTIIFDGTEYLIDDNNVIFTSDNANTIVGRRLGNNEYQWF